MRSSLRPWRGRLLGTLAAAVLSLMYAPPVLVGAGIAPARIASPAKHAAQHGKGRLAAEAYGELPLSFEANRGQTDRRVAFLAHASGYTVFLTSTGAVLRLRAPRISGRAAITRSPVQDKLGLVSQGLSRSGPQSSTGDEEAGKNAPMMVRVKFSRANPRISGLEELPGKSNYFIGNDPSAWRTNVPNYAKVRYEGVYPGVDLVFYGNQRQLECDFVVAPGADPRVIRFAIQGNKTRRIDQQGNLVLGVQGQEVRLRKPLVYQQTGGSRRSIGGKFVIHGAQEVGFEVARYDARKPLIIDPIFTYSTYLGGADTDIGNAIAVDSSGNVYIAGTTSSANFPSASGFQPGLAGSDNAFVSKLNSAGSALVYSTYLGGSASDGASAIALDSAGNAYVTGYTSSANFPTASPFQATNNSTSSLGNAFVTKLNAAGSALVYSTYLGGSNYDFGTGIAVDSSGDAYVAGGSESSDFPTVNALQATLNGSSNAFLAEFNPGGLALIYSTYLGGGNYDVANAIAVDASRNVYLTGSTSSTNFPVVNAFQTVLAGTKNAFVAEIGSGGSALVYSTYLGGNANDQGNGIAVDSSGNAYVTGNASSSTFPVVNALQPTVGNTLQGNTFVSELAAGGSALLYSTYLGGSTYDYGSGIVVDSSGDTYITGYTISPNFPVTESGVEITIPSAVLGSAFVAELGPGGSALLYSTYLGGSSYDYGTGIAIDLAGNIYVTGTASSTDFPTASAFQPVFNGGTSDAFVVKLGSGVSSPPTILPGGIVNAASFASGQPLAPGSIATLFGSNLTDGTSCLSPCSQTLDPAGNLNNQLAGVQVTVNGSVAPLLFASPSQLAFEVPTELSPSGSAAVQVYTGGITSGPSTIDLAPAVPAIFVAGPFAAAQGAILNGLEVTEGISSLAAPVGSYPSAHPAVPGDVVVIFCTGLGAVVPPIPTGVLPSGQMTVMTPTVTIGGMDAEVQFSGLTPGDVGLYQINAVVPALAQLGSNIPVVVSMNGVTSNTVVMSVQ